MKLRRLAPHLLVFCFLLSIAVSTFAFVAALPPLMAGTAAIAVRLSGSVQPIMSLIGSLSIGGAVIAIKHKLASGEEFWVSPFTTADEPNPDIATAPHVPASGQPIIVSGTVYPSVSPYAVSSCNGVCPFQYEIASEIEKVASIHGYNPSIIRPTDPLSVSSPATFGWAWTYNSSSNCKQAPCLAVRIYTPGPNVSSQYKTTSGVVPSNWGVVNYYSPNSVPGVASLFIPMSTVVPSIKCESPSVYDYGVSACITPAGSSEAMADGICRISWSPVNGCPIKSPFDPDCITSSAQVSLSCGSPTTPPAVKIRDLAAPDQKETEVQRPAVPTQGTPGSLTVKERSADHGGNTTTERRTDASAPPTTGSPPIIQGAGQNVLPGVGSNVGATPLEQVAISNWPSSLNVNCTNCTSSAPITFPETMKIDGEVPEGTELPETPELEVSGFLDPIKDRLSSFSGIEFPAHTSQCPVLSIKFNIGGQFIDESSDFLCDLLEEQRAAIQMLMALAFTGIAISIVLRT